MRAVSAVDSPIGGDVRRAGLARCCGQRRTAAVKLQVSGTGGTLAVSRLAAGSGGGEDDAAGESGADGGVPELGERGQDSVPADRVPGPGLALVPAEGVLPGSESGFDRPSAACDDDEIGHGGRAVFRRPAQVEGVLVLLAIRETADQQELPRVRGRDQRPVAVSGSFLPVPA
jgi:hypothetical protein